MNGLCKQQAWYWDKFMCDMGKGSTRDQLHSSRSEETEEYRSLAQAMSRSPRPGEGSDGQSMAKGFKGLRLCFWTWQCGFRKIILVSLYINFTTYKTGLASLSSLKWRWDIQKKIFMKELSYTVISTIHKWPSYIRVQ